VDSSNVIADRVLPAITHLQRRVIAIGVVFTVATVAGVFAFDAPRAGIAVAIPLGVLITVWGWRWYGSLAAAARTGDSVLSVVTTRKKTFDHAYLVVQPVDGSPALEFVVPARKRVRDGEPVTITGDRSSGRLVLSSDTAVTVPLGRARPVSGT
jgi:hypothetical protein